LLLLIAVCETSHTGHNAENVVVNCEDGDWVNVLCCGAGIAEPQLSGVDTGEVACAAGLVLLGAEGKAVNGNGIGNTCGTETSVVVPDLVAGEVLKIPGGEPIGTVEDNLVKHVGNRSRHGGDGSGCGTSGCDVGGAVGAECGSWCSDPDEFLNGVVEVEADGGVGGVSRGGLLLVLELVDEVLVGVLGELATLGCVEVNVVGIHGELCGLKVGVGGTAGEVDVACGKRELDVELDFVVLEGNEGDGKTGVAAEPEAHGNVSFCGCKKSVCCAETLVSVGHPLVLGGWNTGGVVESWLSTSNAKFTLLTAGVALGEIAPHAEPETVLAVNELTSDFEFEGLEKSVGKIGGKIGRASCGNEKAGIVLGPEVLEKISVAADGDAYAGAGVNGTVDGLLNGLNGEVGVAPVNGLEESNLGLTCKVDVLGAVGNELHKSSSHF